MVYWADTETLVSYLRHTFITCDETGVCEATLEPPSRVPKPGAVRVPATDVALDSDEEDEAWSGRESHSPDVHVDPGHRRRSNTAIQLDHVREERRRNAQRKAARWRTPEELTAEQRETLFPLCPIEPLPTEQPASLVSKMVADAAAGPANAFQQYARFQATSKQKAKSFCLLVPTPGVEGVRVSIVPTARISDLIGLACWAYTAEGREPPLRDSVDDYVLRMAEESGEIEEDLPPLNSTEIVGRVGFPVLALVPTSKEANRKVSRTNVPRRIPTVTVNTGGGEKLDVEVEKADLLISELIERALALSTKPKNSGALQLGYVMEKFSEPGVELESDSTIGAALTSQFVLLRANSARPPALMPTDARQPPSTAAAAAIPSPVCHFFHVHLLRAPKAKSKIPVHLGTQPSQKRSMNAGIRGNQIG